MPKTAVVSTDIHQTAQVVKANTKDSQRSRVYKAEIGVRFMSDMTIGYEVMDKEQRLDLSQEFVDRVLARKYIQNKYPTDPIKVWLRPGAYRWAHACGDKIDLPGADTWGFNKLVLVHEIAHIFERRLNGRQFGAHDWPFCLIFLDVTRNVLGKDAANLLKAYFRKNRVRFAPPRPRRMSAEQKKAAAERVEKARAAREKKLKPQRELKEKLIKLYRRKPTGYFNNFGKMTYTHYLGDMRIDRSPATMNHADRQALWNRYGRYKVDNKKEIPTDFWYERGLEVANTMAAARIKKGFDNTCLI